MRLSDDFITRIKESNDIYDIIASYVPLKKSGSDYVCNCPFHSEKTPSCHIYMSTQSFYCFGCGAAGDVINFIRLYEHLDYMEAIRFLAQRSGIPMPEDGGDEGAKIRSRLLEINREAGKFYHKFLFSPGGQNGLNYLLSRGLTQHTIKLYGLGYADENWTTLREHMNSLGFSDEELETASLIVKSSKNNNFYDFFRYRVMFPFFDLRGNIVGFSGRVIGGDDTRKYLNTKETLVYNKSAYLYSMNHAKNSGETNLIMCEGNLDVISLHQYGFKNAVATCGTAMTDHHARIIANQHFEEVTLAYDSDDAGRKATSRALNILDRVGIRAKILKIQGAKDPDEFLKKFGSEAFTLQLNKAEAALDFALDKIKTGLDLSTSQGKSEYLKKSVAFIATIHSSIDRAIYISQVATECDVSRNNVEIAVNKILQSQYKSEQNKQRESIISGSYSKDKINPEANKYPVEVSAERGIIAFLFHSPDFIEKVKSKISPDDFVTEFNRKIFNDILTINDCGTALSVTTIGEHYTAEQVSSIYKIIHDGNTLPYSVERLNDYIITLEKARDKRQRKNVADMSAEELLHLANSIKSKKE